MHERKKDQLALFGTTLVDKLLTADNLLRRTRSNFCQAYSPLASAFKTNDGSKGTPSVPSPVLHWAWLLTVLVGCGGPDRDAVALAEVWDSALKHLDERHIASIRVRAYGGVGRELEFETIDRKTITRCVQATHHVEPASTRAYNQPDGITFVDRQGRTTQMHLNFFYGRHDLGSQMAACLDDLERSPKR